MLDATDVDAPFSPCPQVSPGPPEQLGNTAYSGPGFPQHPLPFPPCVTLWNFTSCALVQCLAIEAQLHVVSVSNWASLTFYRCQWKLLDVYCVRLIRPPESRRLITCSKGLGNQRMCSHMHHDHSKKKCGLHFLLNRSGYTLPWFFIGNMECFPGSVQWVWSQLVVVTREPRIHIIFPCDLRRVNSNFLDHLSFHRKWPFLSFILLPLLVSVFRLFVPLVFPFGSMAGSSSYSVLPVSTLILSNTQFNFLLNTNGMPYAALVPPVWFLPLFLPLVFLICRAIRVNWPWTTMMNKLELLKLRFTLVALTEDMR